jgi:regulator of protease activity HflC (stomatin/prohibitin superfamily)
MARITHLPLAAHLRADASSHVIHYRNGRVVNSGRGLAFWFRSLDTAVAEIPLDDQELPFLFHGRSSDVQEVITQGIVTFRVTDPDTLATRIDFGIDLGTGRHTKTPIEQLSDRLTQLAQQHAADLISRTPLRELVADGVGRLRERIDAGLSADVHLAEMGLAIVSVRVSAVEPSSDVEKALAAPSRELISQEADEAAFARRAAAVDKERAIAENELANRIELARREATLVEQEGANERQRATEKAAASQIATEGRAAERRVASAAEAKAIKAVEGERVALELERLGAYRDVPAAVLMGLAAREFAGKIETIEHLNLTPDLLGTLLADLAQAGTRRLDAGTVAES